jgi:hypothetical protein
MPEILSKNKTVKGLALGGKTLEETFVMFEALIMHQHIFPQMTSNIENPIKDVTTQGESTSLTIPIPALIHFATSSGILDSEVVNVDDLTPIELGEMPSSHFPFSKKRKAIVRREFQQKGGVITKRQRMVYDGQGQSDPEFAKHVVDSLGAFTTTNLW